MISSFTPGSKPFIPERGANGSKRRTGMTWPIFHFQQEDLWARSREPEITEREYYPLNHLYGGAEILRQFAELPAGVPAPWAMQPIMNFRARDEMAAAAALEVKGVKRLGDSGLPIILTINESYAAKLREINAPGVHEVGSMFLYAWELYRRKELEAAAPERRGTLAMPDKSDMFKLVDFDREAYAEKLAGLPEEFQPVYVSMHWRDYDRGCHEPYLRAGLPMVCSGHPNDPLFYERLYDVCRNFKYCCSNEISTSFALSVLSGCLFFYLDGGTMTIHRTDQDGPYVGPEPTLEDPGKKVCVEASPFPPAEQNRARQEILAGNLSGSRFIREPAFFRELWDAGRDQLSGALSPADLSMDDEVSPTQFARWLPFGFDIDGWADAVCGMEIPFREGFAGVEIEFDFLPVKDGRESFIFSWTVDGKEEKKRSETPIVGNRHTVAVPLSADKPRLALTFYGPPPAALPNESRQRSVRLRRIRWIANASETGKPQAPETRETNPDSASWLGKALRFWRR